MQSMGLTEVDRLAEPPSPHLFREEPLVVALTHAFPIGPGGLGMSCRACRVRSRRRCSQRPVA